MLFSIPSVGQHYLIDMIAGTAVAGLGIAMTTAACRGFERAGAGYIFEQATLPPALPEQSPIAARPTIR
jgi:membrane-associated phospholipid phosphatase